LANESGLATAIDWCKRTAVTQVYVECFRDGYQADRTTLTWDAEPSIGRYHVYRDALSALPGLGFGVCLDSDVPGTTYVDPGVPGDGAGYFYLVTAVNRLHEEGTKGITSGGAERGNPAPCP
jgi:hypothetical protein